MNSKKWVIIVSVVVVLLLVVVGYLMFQLQKAKNENLEIVEQYSYEAEQMEQNKTQLEQDYVVLSNDLEGFRLQVNNDSILKKLNDEQKRVQLLLEELRTTKATNTKRINELKNELASVRKVLTYYIAQVDSLNKENTVLRITNLFLAISQLTRKIKKIQQNTISAKVYYIELIIIPIIVIFSLYFFDSVFKVFTKYYFELSME